jgi:hypothetical protein
MFIGVEPKPLSGAAADATWKELTELLNLDPAEFSDPPVNKSAPKKKRGAGTPKVDPSAPGAPA